MKRMQQSRPLCLKLERGGFCPAAGAKKIFLDANWREKMSPDMSCLLKEKGFPSAECFINRELMRDGHALGIAAVRTSTTQLLFRLLLWLTSHQRSCPNRLSTRLQSEVVGKCVSVGDLDAAKKTASLTVTLAAGRLNLFVTDSVPHKYGWLICLSVSSGTNRK